MKYLRKFSIIFVVLLLTTMIFSFYGCASQFKITEILHAGGSLDDLTYLNAQEPFEFYYGLGYRFFEYDLKLSSDGKLIGTHAWEHLEVENPNEITYEQFKTLKLSNGNTPVTEEWLIETIKKHPDVKIIVDTKMDTIEQDAMVSIRFEQLEKIYNYDLSSNIIPEVFSKEMWDILKEQTTFDRYFYSQYKVYYTVDMMIEYFSDDRIYGVCLSTFCDADIKENLYKLKELDKKIFVFTPKNQEEVQEVKDWGADGVYIDNYKIKYIID